MSACPCPMVRWVSQCQTRAAAADDTALHDSRQGPVLISSRKIFIEYHGDIAHQKAPG
jgi:hypothetical protein